ncbi:hypothetical protein [Kitasatospora sp. SUK 42]|uniref:hypothetical protein n=1 Tax=Kitasatospora sp. SUK 42 TaxID=1588882 RepID=UPI0018C98107|nr:hypothetical protein [Kitasatospora sp. SUK 42]MBV2152501.1 hypothetical protein [Kitasatospora sp. SUK 42]
MKKVLYGVSTVLLLAGCGSAGSPPGRDSAPIERQKRSLACGTSVAPPVAQSTDSDPVHLVVTAATVDEQGVTLSYRITASDPKTMLTVPIGEVPPTGLLLRDGRIVATTKPAGTPSATDGTPTVNGLPAIGFPVGQRPYEQTLLIDTACPGTTFKDVIADPARYRATVIMSAQNLGMPKDTTTPLVEDAQAPEAGR